MTASNTDIRWVYKAYPTPLIMAPAVSAMENPPTPAPVAAPVVPGLFFICGVSGAESRSGAGVGGGGPGIGDLLLSSLGVLVRNKPVLKSLTRLIGELQGHGGITSRATVGHDTTRYSYSTQQPTNSYHYPISH
jgi:hypothetical protein